MSVEFVRLNSKIVNNIRKKVHDIREKFDNFDKIYKKLMWVEFTIKSG